MKKEKKKYLLVSLVLTMTFLSAGSVFASDSNFGPGNQLSEEYNITDDDYIVAEEMTIEALEEIVAVNSKAVVSTTNEMQTAAVHYTVVDKGYPARLSDDLQDWVYKMCAEYGISGYEKVILSKLYCESSYNSNITHKNRNGTTDYGIAQINSSNHERLRRDIGITNFMDPYQSIRAGVYMYAECLRANGYNEEMALAAYNTGRNGIHSTPYTKRVMTIKNSAYVS